MTEERTYAYNSKGVTAIRFRIAEHGGNGLYKLSYKFPQYEKRFKPYPGLRGKRTDCMPADLWAALEVKDVIGERIS